MTLVGMLENIKLISMRVTVKLDRRRETRDACPAVVSRLVLSSPMRAIYSDTDFFKEVVKIDNYICKKVVNIELKMTMIKIQTYLQHM